MSFVSVRDLATSRFNEIQVFLNFITSQEPNSHLDPIPAEVLIMRGLFYVHLYSALEKSVNEAVQKTLVLVNSDSVKNIHYTLAFNTISVNDKLKSLKDCSHKRFVQKSVQLFEEVGSRRVGTINETTFSNSLQNVWIATIEEMFSAFGIKDFPIEQREKTTINEIVDKRNAVAHGRESASFVGERHRASILRSKFQITQDFTMRLIDAFQEFYDNKKYLKPIMKKHYT
jgi:hypothetical protein